MPLKHTDPFACSINRLDAKVNPYVAMLREAGATGSLPVLFGDGLRDAAGRWRTLIADFHKREWAPRALVVEIGCHKGHTLLAMARDNPDVAFVGIDITYKRVVTTAQRAQAAGLQNIFCVMANAVSLDKIFAAGELDGVVIFFPDPWVKKKSQAKNRLVDGGFCQRLTGVLADEGFCWLKTDQKIYFDAATEHLTQAAFETWPQTTGVAAQDYSSVFEQRFKEQGLPTYGAQWRRGAVARGAVEAAQREAML